MPTPIHEEALAVIGHPCTLRARHSEAYVNGWITPSGYGHFMNGYVPTVIEPAFVETKDVHGLYLCRAMVAQRIAEVLCSPAEFKSRTDWDTPTDDSLACEVTAIEGNDVSKLKLLVGFQAGTAQKVHLESLWKTSTTVATHE